MGFWDRLFGANNETTGFVQQDSNDAVSRVFGFDGSAQMVRYGGKNVYTPDGRYLGNSMPNAGGNNNRASSSSQQDFLDRPSTGGYQGYTRDAQGKTNGDRLREFTANKLRNGG